MHSARNCCDLVATMAEQQKKRQEQEYPLTKLLVLRVLRLQICEML